MARKFNAKGYESDSIRKKGCYADPDDKTIVVHEVWAEKANQEAYLGWRSETGVVAKIVSMLREPPVFEERVLVSF